VTRADNAPTPAAATVSLIVVNFDGRHHLEQCLPALASQTRRAEQMIVVDNGSSDGSVDFVRSRYPEVEIVELTDNLGFTGGNLAGYGAAAGDYIVLLNNDTKPEPDWLERLAACADSLPDVGMVASHMTDWEGVRTDTAGDGCTVTGRGFKLRQGRSTSEPLASGYVFGACAGAALYKRAMLDEIGFFEENFYMNAEDTDLAFRAQLAGWKAYLCATAVVRHRIGGSQEIYSPRHVYYSTRNHVWVLFRCMPLRLIAKHAAANLLQGMLYFAFYTRQRRLGAHLSGLAAAIGGLPRVLGERRGIQGRRRTPVRELEGRLAPLGVLIRAKLLSRSEPARH
jgi:GT2 family glycosyltransferase